MRVLPDELRLAVAIAINALIFISAVRFVKKQGVRDGVQVGLDACLLWYLIQYLSVALPGLLGWLNAWTMLATAIVCCAAIARIPRPASSSPDSEKLLSVWQRRGVELGLTLLLSFIAGIILNQSAAPVLANDALTYHLPAAVQWIQTGRIGLYETWFYNPANTYSPLAGSMFAAWLIGPIANDALAKFVEAPPLVMLFLGVLQLARCLGASTSIAVIIALSASCARPFISQIILAKDDLFLAAFFAAAVVACARPRLSDRLGAWRLGAAVGLFFATKYTALFSLPVLLLLIDAPWKARWQKRDYALAIGMTALLAGPWYLRNAILTGNPLFPADVTIAGVTIFQGMFTPLRSDRLIGLTTIIGTFTGSESGAGYYNLSPFGWIPLLLLWCAAVVRGIRGSLREPLVRACLFGPVLGIGLFIFTSPYGETRFAYPSLLLLFASAAYACGWIGDRRLSWIPSALLAAATISTSFAPVVLNILYEPLLEALPAILGIMVTVECYWFARATHRLSMLRALIGIWLSGALVLAGMVYVYWVSYTKLSREAEPLVWGDRLNYGPIVHAWTFVRDELPHNEPIAYTNIYFTYPLFGFELDRPLVYAPIRPGVHSIRDLGRFDRPTTGEEIPKQIAVLTMRGGDARTWMANLRRRGAKYILIARQNIAAPDQFIDPPELAFARNDPARFHQVFRNEAASIFQIVDLPDEMATTKPVR